MRSTKTWPCVAFMALGTAILRLTMCNANAAEEPAGILEGHEGAVHSLALSPDGKTLASGSADMTIKLWDLPTRKVKQTLKGDTGAINTVAFSPDGATLASGSADKSIRLWDPATGKELATLQGPELGVAFLAFSPDRKTLASGGGIAKGRSEIKLWDTTEKKDRLSLEVEGPLYQLGFSPDGAEVVAANRRVKCWDAATGKERPSPCKIGGVVALAFSPDGKQVATGIAFPARDDDVYLWNAETGEEQAHLYPKLWDISCLTYSPDGKILVAGGRSFAKGGVWWIHLPTGKGLPPLVIPKFRTAVFSPDGKSLLTADDGPTIKLWTVPAAPETKQP